MELLSGDEASKLKIFDELLSLEKEYQTVRDHIREGEKEFSKQFITFLSYKDNADLIDNFEQALNILKKEKPLIEKSITKITQSFQ